MNRTDLLAALNTTPAELISLTRLYPGPWLTLRGNDEGDWHGQITDPMHAYNDVADAWGAEAMAALHEPTLGLLGEDAMLLLHVRALQKAGLTSLTAQLLAVDLRKQMTDLESLAGREELLYGYIPLWDMDAQTGVLAEIGEGC